MNEKKSLNPKNNPKEILDLIVEYQGIDYIRGYVKGYNNKSRKQNKRGNNYKNIAIEIYDMVVNDGYLQVRAMDELEIKYNLMQNTIRNHIAKFNKEIKTMMSEDVYTFIKDGYPANFDELDDYDYDRYKNRIQKINNHLISKFGLITSKQHRLNQEAEDYFANIQDDEIPL